MSVRTTHIGRLLYLALPLTAVLCSSVMTRSAHPIIIRPDRDDQRYRDLATQFPAACWILPGGTGTLVAPRWVLTAAHVIRGRGANYPPGGTAVEFGDRRYKVRRFVLHPDWALIEGAHEKDLALLELEEPVSGVSPIPLYVGHAEVGKLGHLVGYGFSGTFDTGQPTGDGDLYNATVPTKRAATNVITGTVRDLLITTIEPLELATDLEGSCGTADSGGPLLVYDQGRMTVAGVASELFGDDLAQRYGGGDRYVRVSSYARWIERTTGTDFGAASPHPAWLLIGFGFITAIGISTWRWIRRGRLRKSLPSQ